MHLSPLQSRLAASLAASLMVAALYLLLSSPKLALAAEIPLSPGVPFDLEGSYEPEFAPFDRSILGRAASGVTALANNAPESLNLDPGVSACYVVEKDMLFGSSTARGLPDHVPRETTSKTLYISANTCLQPGRTKSDSTSPPPQLTLYVSNSTTGECPTSSHGLSADQWQTFDEGAVMYSINATGDIYIGLTAPNITSDYDGVYNFELAASTDDYYHSYDSGAGAELLWMDSDSSSALLFTRNMTTDPDEAKQILSQPAPYELFVENDARGEINGLWRSVCGLKNTAQILADPAGDGMLSELVRTSLTTQGPGGFPKQQFYFEGLNESSSYTGILVKPGDDATPLKRDTSTAGGGGTVFQPTKFQTSPNTNCKIVTDMEFCDEIQYAVPGNNNLSNTDLAKAYDDYAKNMYSNFQKVMMQIPCEASREDSYSLARGCDDCMSAYKTWLCTVSIPRCEDFTSNSSYAILRNAGQPFPNGTKLPADVLSRYANDPPSNSSRNSFIDEKIKPGPYKEILPCEDVCYAVVQSCPAAIGFACPRPGKIGFNTSYGRRKDGSDEVTCNFPGESRTMMSAAALLRPATAASVAIVAPIVAILAWL